MSTLSLTALPGTGLAIVFLHGVFMDRHLWDDVSDRLVGHRRVLVDMPGHGSSDGMDRGSTLGDHITAVAGTLDAHGLAGVVIVGHSWGGMVGLRLAHERPDLVTGLVLANTPLVRPTGGGRVGFLAQEAILAAGFPLGAYAAAAARALHGDGHLASHPDVVTGLRHRIRTMGRARVRRTVRSVILDPGDAVDLVTALAIPHRIVGGADDYVLANGILERLRAAGEDVVVTPGGHTGPVEAPAHLATAVREVVARLAEAEQLI